MARITENEAIDAAEQRGFFLRGECPVEEKLQFINEAGICLWVSLKNNSFWLTYWLTDAPFQLRSVVCMHFTDDQHFESTYRQFKDKIGRLE